MDKVINVRDTMNCLAMAVELRDKALEDIIKQNKRDLTPETATFYFRKFLRQAQDHYVGRCINHAKYGNSQSKHTDPATRFIETYIAQTHYARDKLSETILLAREL